MLRNIIPFFTAADGGVGSAVIRSYGHKLIPPPKSGQVNSTFGTIDILRSISSTSLDGDWF